MLFVIFLQKYNKNVQVHEVFLKKNAFQRHVICYIFIKIKHRSFRSCIKKYNMFNNTIIKVLEALSKNVC